MSDIAQILALAKAVDAQRRSDEPVRERLSADLYRAVIEADPVARAELMALAPPDAGADQAWRRNNLRIAPPYPQRVITGMSDRSMLERFVRRAASQGQTMKAIGDGWGMSSAAVSRDWLVPMVDSFDSATVTGDGRCLVGGGARIRTVNAALGDDWALANAPGFDGLTFAGAMSTFGHGSGIGFGPLASQVRSLRMLTVDAAGGVVPRHFAASDPLFPALATSLGAFGIITELEVGVEKAFFLEETRSLRRWSEVRVELPGLLGPGRPVALHSVEVWLNPYRVRGEVWCVVTRRQGHMGPPQGQRSWSLTHGDAASFRALAAFMRLYPELIPEVMYGGLALTASSGVVLPSSESMGFGTANHAPVISSEVAVGVGDAIATVDRLIQAVQARAGAWVTSPIGVRFVAASSAWISPACRRDTCTIEMPLLEGTPRALETLQWFLRDAVPYGRPHWGQYNPLTPAELRVRYPERSTAAFVAALEVLDPRRVFVNEFIADLWQEWAAPGGKPPVIDASTESTASCADSDTAAYSSLFCDPRGFDIYGSKESGTLAALQQAKSNGVRLTCRAGGYAMHTQSIRRGEAAGFYFPFPHSTSSGIQVSVDPPQVAAQATATWHEIVHATLAEGLLPKVIVTAPNATIGGTLASNSIGQASRRFGLEADGVATLRVVVPGGAGQGPSEMDLRQPAPGDTSAPAKLFRAVVRGYGHIGVIDAATYDLTQAGPGDKALPPVDECHGLGSPENDQPRCVAASRMDTYAPGDLQRALDQLVGVPNTADDGEFRACVLFRGKSAWEPRITRTWMKTDKLGPHLVTYEGNTLRRKTVESLLSTMGSAYVAGRVAAELTRNDTTEYHDPVCGFMFAMLPNQEFKAALPKSIRRHFKPSIQMTFIVPQPKVMDFLSFAFQCLRIHDDPGNREKAGETVERVSNDGSLWNALLDVAEKSRDLENEHLGERRPSTPDDPARTLRSFLADFLVPNLLVPSLFEIVWLPPSAHYLSALHGAAGYAVSMAFQGPGTNKHGELEQWWPFSVVLRELHRALPQLSEKALELGGGAHLTKNVFVGDDSKGYVKRMLGKRFHEFVEIRRQYDEGGVLATSFGDEILGLEQP